MSPSRKHPPLSGPRTSFREVAAAPLYFPPGREAGGLIPDVATREPPRLVKSRDLDLAQMAGDVVAGEELAHFGLLPRAAREGVGAAGGEAAARGWVALQDDAFRCRLRIEDRHGRHQRLDVGVLRAGDESCLRSRRSLLSYMTAMWRLMCSTTARSWATKR